MHLLMRFLLPVMLCCICLAPANASGPTTPVQTVEFAQQAIVQNNSSLFMQAVDLKSVVQHGIAEALDLAATDAKVQQIAKEYSIINLLLQARLQTNDAQLTFVSQLLTSEIQEFIVAGINGGHFNGSPNGKTNPSRSLLFSHVSPAKKSFSPAKIVSQKATQATISTVFTDAQAGSFPLELQAEKNGERWLITRIANMPAVLHKALK